MAFAIGSRPEIEAQAPYQRKRRGEITVFSGECGEPAINSRISS